VILTNQQEPIRAHWESANPLDDPSWDELVMTHPHYSFFHGADWARVLRDTYQVESFYKLRREGGRLRELLPLMEIESSLGGRRGVSLPFTDECGPLRFNGTGSREIFDEIQRIGLERGWRYWDGRGDWDFAPASLAFWGHELSLDSQPENSFKRFRPSVRRAIRKAERSGLAARVENSQEAMRAFFQLHCETRRKHGVPPQPIEFFENIYHCIIARNGGVVVIARLGTQPLAAAVFFYLGTRAVFKFGASALEFLALRGNSLVMWEAIRWLSSHGIEHLDFGRTSHRNHGLRRYKCGFGATERGIPMCRYDFRKQEFVACVDRAAGWYNHVFRSMPLPLLRLSGRMLYRYLAWIAACWMHVSPIFEMIFDP
jgi:CelD/BcsL family acetyltransferase involved in cellulose biosynthesis